MQYRYLHAEYLFTGEEIIPDGVLVTDSQGIVQDIVYDIPQDAKYYPGILSPGFINCHCHIELSHLKGRIAPNSGMVPFLMAIMEIRKNREQADENSMKLAMANMRKSGIVAVGDICNTAESIALKKRSGLYFHNFIEATGFVDGNASTRFTLAKNLLEQFLAELPRQRSSIVPHAPYSVSPTLFKLIGAEAKDAVISMHNQESEAEIEFLDGNGGALEKLYESFQIPIPSGNLRQGPVLADEYFSRAAKFILVHNVHTRVEEIQALNHPNAFWCLCPKANIYISGHLPPVNRFRDCGATIVMGTDSLASNDQLSILSEIKAIATSYSDIGIEEVLKWATLNGARALGIDNVFGSFEKGKKPGMVRIEYIDSTDQLGGIIDDRTLPGL